MAVAIDNAGASVGATAVSSKTLTSFAVGAGANRLLVVGVSQWSATDRAPSGNFNTTDTLTLHDAATVAESPGTRRASILYRIAPSNATATITINFAGTVDELVIGATSWTGADQTAPLGTAVKATGTASSTSINVTGASGGAVHDVLAADGGGAVAATPNQTQRWRAIAAASTTEGAGQSAAGTGSATAMSWTALSQGSSTVFAQIGVPLVQVSAGGTNMPIVLVGEGGGFAGHTRGWAG